MGKQAVMKELEKVYESPQFAQAVQQAAIAKAPSLFAQAGISLDGRKIELESPSVDELADKIEPSKNGNKKEPFLA